MFRCGGANGTAQENNPSRDKMCQSSAPKHLHLFVDARRDRMEQRHGDWQIVCREKLCEQRLMQACKRSTRTCFFTQTTRLRLSVRRRHASRNSLAFSCWLLICAVSAFLCTLLDDTAVTRPEHNSHKQIRKQGKQETDIYRSPLHFDLAL